MRAPTVNDVRAAADTVARVRRAPTTPDEPLRFVPCSYWMRTRRHHLPEQVFTNDCRFVSLTCCTCDRRPVFNDTVSSLAVVNALHGLHGVDQRVLAYCVMPDHVHVVVALNRIPPGRFVQAAKSITTRNLRDTGQHTAIWQRGYYDHVIRRRDGLFRSIRYVLLNPVRKGLVDCWWKWPYSGSCQWAEMDNAFLDDRAAESSVWDGNL